MKIHFVSFASSNLILTLKRIESEAKKCNFFDQIHTYTEKDIPEFMEQHNDFIYKNKKGFGYWIWKPYIVLKVLNTIEEGDILVFLDAGCSINSKGKDRFNEYVNMCINSEYKNICFQYTHYTEIQYTKKAVLEHLNVPIEHQNSGQLIGGVFMLQKCDFTKKLIEEYYNNCCIYNLLNDEILENENKDFIANRHDQSIFSCIRKIYGTVYIKNECDILTETDIDKNSYLNCPFWAIRIRNTINLVVYIFSWKRVSQNSADIFNEIRKITNNVFILNCDENFTFENENIIELNDSYYFSNQFEAATKHCMKNFPNYNMMTITGDISPIADWRNILERNVYAIENLNAGISAPNVDYTAHTDKKNQITDNFWEVPNTDCTVWTLTPKIYKFIYNTRIYEWNKFGWGIDWLAVQLCKKYKIGIIRDYNHTISHPKDKGYENLQASEEFDKVIDLWNKEYSKDGIYIFKKNYSIKI